MKEKNGFTLIELLAVIVILAIIALIAVPTIINIVKKAKKSAFKDSAYGIVESANLYYAVNMLQGNEDSTKTFIYLDGKLVTNLGEELEFKGGDLKSGSKVVVNEYGDVSINITNGTYFATKEFDETEILVSDKSNLVPTRDELAAQIKELNDKIDNNWNKIYPVGSIYTSINDTNPSELFGGTWERYANGKTLVGVDEEDNDFKMSELIGGEKNHTLTIAEMPKHNHTFLGHYGYTQGVSDSTVDWNLDDTNYNYYPTSFTGESQPHNNMQPYITVYVWKRVN